METTSCGDCRFGARGLEALGYRGANASSFLSFCFPPFVSSFHSPLRSIAFSVPLDATCCFAFFHTSLVHMFSSVCSLAALDEWRDKMLKCAKVVHDSLLIEAEKTLQEELRRAKEAVELELRRQQQDILVGLLLEKQRDKLLVATTITKELLADELSSLEPSTKRPKRKSKQEPGTEATQRSRGPPVVHMLSAYDIDHDFFLMKRTKTAMS
eukprot:m.148919 g.148919  ORF g.148919 m.148919 type:complete len:212 (-) comp16147_c2_seq1:490-1125(-)